MNCLLLLENTAIFANQPHGKLYLPRNAHPEIQPMNKKILHLQLHQLHHHHHQQQQQQQQQLLLSSHSYLSLGFKL